MNRYNPNLHHRRSIRLHGYDYSQEGLYFVTVCTQHHTCLLGEIADGEMRLNGIGEMVEECWLAIPQHYPNTALHNHMVMPNHFHGIIEITRVGVENIRPLNVCQPWVENNRVENIRPLRRPNCESGTIGAIIRGFKIGTTKNIGYSVWQRNYHEHIIRNRVDHARINDYITHNPANWNIDCFYNQPQGG